MRRILGFLLAAGLAGGSAVAADAARRTVAVVLDDRSPATRALATAGIARLGGRVVHALDDVLVVDLPAGSEFRALQLAGVRQVEMNAGADRSGRGRDRSVGLAAWNAIAGGGATARDRGGSAAAEVPPDDALLPPAADLDAVRASSRFAAPAAAPGGRRFEAATSSPRGPFGATDVNTSEYLAGSVSVTIVLPESDGSVDPSTETWSADREADVVARIAAGLEWVRLQEPQAGLSFVYHLIAGRTDPRARTSYEPIRRAADPGGTTGEDLWVKQIASKLGYASGDRFTRMRAFDADTRAADGTDWAVTIFVADSLVDADGKFADGRFAYTWIGGPHMVLTYDDAAWGIDRMDMVVRHEILHSFWAFDEYAASACTCSEHRGYLDGADANCTACNPAFVPCVMITDGDAMCPATRRQIGWADLDGDGTIDVVGEDPATFLDPVTSPVCGVPALSGLATVVAPTNRNPATSTSRASISINRIAGVDVRADGAPWAAASAADGGWGLPQERFSASFAGLTAGWHHLEARAIDDHGNLQAAAAVADVAVYAPAASMGDTVRASRLASGSVQLGWSPCPGATSYRIYRASSGAGPWTAAAVAAAASWVDAAPSGPAYYQVRPVDACGAEQAP
jgi:hypothetical protein